MPTLYVRSVRALWRNTPGAVLLLHVDRGDVVQLTGTGVALWELLAEPIDVKRASELLAGQFEATAEEVLPDVQSVLHQLVEHHLVEELVGV